MLKVTIGLLFLTLIFSACMVLPCERGKIAGINSMYTITDSEITLTQQCNGQCNCDNVFNPVCSEDKKLSYLSPCHAGCSSSPDESFKWNRCSCPMLRNISSSNVNKGWCPSDCKMTKYVFFILFSLVCFFVFATAPLIQSTSMKIVTFDHRDSYICFSWLWMRGLGSVPGAIAFGMVIDKTCIKWTRSCGSDAKCVLYDSDILGIYIFIFTLVTKLLCIGALWVTIRSYIPMTSTGTEENEKKDVPLRNFSESAI